MKSPLIASALVASVAGAALEPNVIKRTPMPIATPAPNCVPSGPTFMDYGFNGDGSAYGIDPPNGTLKIKTAFGGKDGLQSDSTGTGSFSFRVLSGAGTFDIYQEVCLTPNKPYSFNYDVGITAPPAGKPASTTGCTSQIVLNGQPIGYASQICGNGVNAPTSYGQCNLASDNKKTFYWQQGTLFQTQQAVNKLGISFTCTNVTASGYNAQAQLDSLSANKIYTPGDSSNPSGY